MLTYCSRAAPGAARLLEDILHWGAVELFANGEVGPPPALPQVDGQPVEGHIKLEGATLPAKGSEPQDMELDARARSAGDTSTSGRNASELRTPSKSTPAELRSMHDGQDALCCGVYSGEALDVLVNRGLVPQPWPDESGSPGLRETGDAGPKSDDVIGEARPAVALGPALQLAAVRDWSNACAQDEDGIGDEGGPHFATLP